MMNIYQPNTYRNRYNRKKQINPQRSFFFNAVTNPVLPMRVMEQESLDQLRFPAAAELKYDGIRAIVRVNQGRPSLQSKMGHDMGGAYPSLMSVLGQLPDGLYDGEIFHSHIRGQPAAMRDSNQVDVRYSVFDVISCNLPWMGRRMEVVRRVKQVKSNRIGYSRLIGIAKCKQDIDKLVKPVLKDKEEGIVLKPIGGKYYPGGEKREWVKVKS